MKKILLVPYIFSVLAIVFTKDEAPVAGRSSSQRGKYVTGQQAAFHGYKVPLNNEDPVPALVLLNNYSITTQTISNSLASGVANPR